MELQFLIGVASLDLKLTPNEERSMRLSSILITAAAAAALAGAANAAPINTHVDSIDPYATPAGETPVIDFDTMNTSPYSFDAKTVVTSGTESGVAAAPYLVTEDTSKYGYVTQGNSPSVLSLPGGVSALSLLWGSVDAYNELTFYDGATEVGSVSGSNILDPSNGYEGNGGSALVDFKFSTPVDKVVFASSQNSFEFDNIAVTAAPEPGIWALMLGGLGILGGVLRVLQARRREDSFGGSLA